MPDHNNIIPFTERNRRGRLAERVFNKRRVAGEPPVDPILEKLKADEWSLEWYPKFARNLGEMATILNPSEPKRAAKDMFFEAFGQDAGDANWRKRKRYLRFDGEDTPYDRDGEYVARKEPYLSLAKAFAKLFYPRDSYGVRKAYRLLVKGTALGPTIDVSKIDGLTQAIECIKRISERCIEDPEIAEAFSHLKNFPIAPFAADEFKLKFPPGHPSHRDLREEDLTTTHRGRGLAIVSAQTSTISTYLSSISDLRNSGLPLHYLNEQRPWYVGRVLVGYLYFPEFIVHLKLGLSENDFLSRLEELTTDRTSELEFVSELINEALDKLKVDHPFDDENYRAETIPDVLRHMVYVRKPVYLTIDHDGEGIVLKIDISGETTGDNDEFEVDKYFGIKFHDVVVYSRGKNVDEDKVVMIFDGALRGRNVGASGLEEMSDWAFQIVQDEGSIYAISGGSSHDYCNRIYNAECDDVDFRDALFEGATESSIFVSVVWDDRSQLSAAPQGSVAGAILRNLAYAPEECRIDTLLIGNARTRLRGIVEFVRGELQRTNAALRERGLEP